MALHLSPTTLALCRNTKCKSAMLFKGDCYLILSCFLYVELYRERVYVVSGDKDLSQRQKCCKLFFIRQMRLMPTFIFKVLRLGVIFIDISTLAKPYSNHDKF